MKILFFSFVFLLFSFALQAQDYKPIETRSVAEGNIPGDNVLRYYRLALPVTLTAYEEDLESSYDNVLQFWQECEDFVNRMFVPLGFCFDVVVDGRLVMSAYNSIDENIYNAPSFGTELLNDAISSDSYDVGMWVHHRSVYDENSGLSVEGGVYSANTKGSGYAKTDRWVIAHEIGHLFGANHTSMSEGSLMNDFGEFFSYPSIKRIREASASRNAAYYIDKERTNLMGVNAGGNYTYGKSVTNSAPVFIAADMKDTYTIPSGACIAIPLSASDADGDVLTYSAIGCSSVTVGNVNEHDGFIPYFASLSPQTSNIIDYSPEYFADIYDENFFLIREGTDVPALATGFYNISFLVNDMPQDISYDILETSPFYSNYSVWDATVNVVDGTPFNASILPAKEAYSAGDEITVNWGVNEYCFTSTTRLRITMSSNYGKSFDYILAESVPALDGCCKVVLPNVNVENINVGFLSPTGEIAARNMRGGIIRIEEIGGVAYTLTTFAPEVGGGFTVKCDSETGIDELEDATKKDTDIYDLAGRKVEKNAAPGIYIVNGKKIMFR